MSDTGNSLIAAKEVAATRGQIVILPKDNELFVDIDDEESLALFRSCIEMMSKKIGELPFKQRPSPSGRPGRYHIVVTMPREVTPIERIAIQAFLGSDRKRECLSWCRMQDGETTVTRFFEKPA